MIDNGITLVQSFSTVVEEGAKTGADRRMPYHQHRIRSGIPILERVSFQGFFETLTIEIIPRVFPISRRRPRAVTIRHGNSITASL